MNIDRKKLKEEIRLMYAYRRNNQERLNQELQAMQKPEWKDPWKNGYTRETMPDQVRYDEYNTWHREVLKPFWNNYHGLEARFSASRATALYSLISHLRGHLHVAKIKVQRRDGDRHYYETWPRTMKDQEELIKPYLAEFEAPAEEAKAAS